MCEMREVHEFGSPEPKYIPISRDGERVRIKLNPELNDEFDTEDYCIMRIGDVETGLGFVTMSTFDGISGVIEKTSGGDPYGKRVHYVKVPVEVVVLVYDEEIVDEQDSGVDSGTSSSND